MDAPKDLGARTPFDLTKLKTCTVEPVGIRPAGPGVTHDASRWMTTVQNKRIFGSLLPAPRQTGSRSVGLLRRPERGTADLSPTRAKVCGYSTSSGC
jgi:hypothetical protein